MYDPEQLRTFLAVAESLSFTRAAARLEIGQPTVSQHVRKLESSVGRRLFVRDTRTVRLTADGDALAEFARTILSAHQRAETYFSGSGLSGRLRFGVADDLALTPLPRILRDFRRLYHASTWSSRWRKARAWNVEPSQDTSTSRSSSARPESPTDSWSAGIGWRGWRWKTLTSTQPTHSTRGLSGAERDPFAWHSGTGPSWPKPSDHLHHSGCQRPAGRDARRARGGDLRAIAHSRRPRRAAARSPATRARGVGPGAAHRSTGPHRSGKRTDHGDHEPGLGSHSHSRLTIPVGSGVVGDVQRVMMSVLSSAPSATRRSTASELASAAGRTNL